MTSSAGWSAAAHLVRSMGFGASGDLVDAVAAAGPSAWLQASLRAAPESDPGAAAAPAPTFEALPPAGQDASTQQKQQRRKQAADQVAELTAWWIRRMVAGAEPVVEKLTFGWHNHFATSATKVRSAPMLMAQNATLRRPGPRFLHRPRCCHGRPTPPCCSGWTASRTPSRRPTRTSRASSWSCSPSAARAGTPSRTCARERGPSPAGPSTARPAPWHSSPTARLQPRPSSARPATSTPPGSSGVLLDQPHSAPFVATRVAAPSPDPRAAGGDARPPGHRVRPEPGPHRAFQDAHRRRYTATPGSLVASPVSG